MRINPISNNCNKSNNNNSFTGRRDVRQKATGFAETFIDATNTNNLNKRGLEHLARQYIPSLVIRESKNSDNFAIVCDPYYKISYTDNICHLKSQTIHIPKISKNAKHSQKADFVDYIVHEMTHAFQNADKETSFITRYNNYLQNNSIEQLLSVGQISRNLFDYLETKVVYPMMDTLYVKAIDKSLKNVSTAKEMMDIVIPEAQTELKDAVISTLPQMTKNLKLEDKNFIIADINDNMQSEEDAYRAGLAASKKYSNTHYLTVEDIIPELYETLSEATKECL